MRAKRLAFVERQDVEVQMKYGLPRGRLIVLPDLKTIGIEGGLGRAGNPLHRGHKGRKSGKFRIEQIT